MTGSVLTTDEAAAVLGLSAAVVGALVEAGHLRGSGGTVPIAEVKSFQARNLARDDNVTAELLTGLGSIDNGADDILDALEAAIPDMARRITDRALHLFRQTDEWTADQLAELEVANRRRFAAILAVTRGNRTDDELLVDLAELGSDAAFAGTDLPAVLGVLRMSRDLLVQAAIGAAEELGHEWGLALAVVLTRVLPVQDRLADTITRGYWSAVLTREQEAFARYEHVVEHSASAIYEVDLAGRIVYANPRLAELCDVERTETLGRELATVLPPIGGCTDPAVYRTPTESTWRPLRLIGGDGRPRDVMLQVTARTREGALVGFDGIVREVIPDGP